MYILAMEIELKRMQSDHKRTVKVPVSGENGEVEFAQVDYQAGNALNLMNIGVTNK
jgi:hypothetical protein